MPMVFTLASHLRESLTAYKGRKAREADERASRKREAELEAEAEKFRGTAVTAERFAAWRADFDRQQARLKGQAEAEHLATLSSKERDEYRRAATKPSGRQLFSKAGAAIEEDKGTDESVKEVDWTLYSREDREKQANEDDEQSDGIVLDDDDA